MSGFEISPATISATHVIQRYGNGQFRIADTVYDGSVIVFPDHAELWAAYTGNAVSADHLAMVIKHADSTDILILGCGDHFTPPPKELRSTLKEHGIVLEWMDTGAACRTYNVLLSEARRVAAALIAVE